MFGISKGGFAAPIAILAIPVMSLSMSPTKAAGILLPILILMDLLAMYIYWNKWDLKNIKIIIPTSIIGIFNLRALSALPVSSSISLTTTK